MYCPSCGSEYREGYTECADCKVPLVERLPFGAKRKGRVPIFPTIPKLPDNRPLLVKIVPFLAFILGGEVVLIVLLALVGVGKFSSAGRAISSREFLAQA